jgi:hypothetical protein
VCEGRAESTDLVSVSLPPVEAPLMEQVSTLLSMEWSKGYKTHLGSLESDKGMSRSVCGKEATGQLRMFEILICSF